MTHLVLAFKQPPEIFGFVRSQRGTSWLFHAPTKEGALKLGRYLAAHGIHGVIKKVRPQPASAHYVPRTNGIDSAIVRREVRRYTKEEP